MNAEMLVDYYRRRGLGEDKTRDAVAAVEELETWLQHGGVPLDRAEPGRVSDYVAGLAKEGKNQLDRIVALARYYYLMGRQDVYLYFMQVLGGLGVMESIRDRIDRLAGERTSRRIFDGLPLPPLGTPLGEMPSFTGEVVRRMEAAMEPERVRAILAGNNHGVPRESQLGEKELYEACGHLDAYLKGRHGRKVRELQEHCDQGKIWFEQQITQEVVDYVASNQEILSAVRDGDRLYVTKIPYDGVRYLKETDPVLKRYYGCHCSFAREAILSGREAVPPSWCYCSAGFAKFPFEVILGREMKAVVLQSVLQGDAVCRFELSPAEGALI